MLLEALTIAAGRLNFTPGQQFDMPTAEARDLIAIGAAREVKAERQATEPVATKSKGSSGGKSQSSSE